MIDIAAFYEFARPPNSLLPTVAPVIDEDPKAPGGPDRPSPSLIINLKLNTVQNYLVKQFSSDPTQTLQGLIQDINANYSDAGTLLNDKADEASKISAILFLNDILNSPKFIPVRMENNLNTIDDLERFAVALLLEADFDRSFNQLDYIQNSDGSIDIIPSTEDQYYINHLQMLLVQRLLEEGKKQVLEKYANDPNIVFQGELTDEGRILALLTLLSYTGATRMEQTKIPVLTTPDLQKSITELINNINITPQQQAFIQYILTVKPTSDYLPNYGTLYPGQPLYDYFNALADGQRSDVHEGVLYFRKNGDGGIDIYLAGNLSQIAADVARGDFSHFSVEAMKNRVKNLFPMPEQLKFLIARHWTLTQASGDQMFKGAFRIMQDVSSSDLISHAISYNSERDRIPELNSIMDDRDFASSKLLFNIISLLAKTNRFAGFDAGISNLRYSSAGLRGIFVYNFQELNDLSYNSYFMPYQIDKFKGWLNFLADRNVVIKNPNEDIATLFPFSISFIFSGEATYIQVRSFDNNLQMNVKDLFQVNDSGFAQVLGIPNTGDSTIEYFLPLNS